MRNVGVQRGDRLRAAASLFILLLAGFLPIALQEFPMVRIFVLHVGARLVLAHGVSAALHVRDSTRYLRRPVAHAYTAATALVDGGAAGAWFLELRSFFTEVDEAFAFVVGIGFLLLLGRRLTQCGTWGAVQLYDEGAPETSVENPLADPPAAPSAHQSAEPPAHEHPPAIATPVQHVLVEPSAPPPPPAHP